MIGKCFIDTNVIVYGFDKENESKRMISQDLISKIFISDIYFISTQVLGEFCNIAEKKIVPGIPLEKIERFINTFPENAIIRIDTTDIIRALRIKERYKYGFWDCLIIATAFNAGCNVLYSEDLQPGQVIDDALTIINPYI